MKVEQGGSIFLSVDEILKCDHSNEALLQYFDAVLFLFVSILHTEIWDFFFLKVLNASYILLIIPTMQALGICSPVHRLLI